MRTLLAAASALVLAAGLVMGLGTAVPRIAHACSCVAPMAIAEYATEDNVIFAGDVIEPDEGGVRIGVTDWFSGTEPGPVVRLAGDFEGGGMCGLGFVPAQGTSWIAVAWRPPDDNPLGELEANENLQVSICQPFMDLSTPEGQAFHAEAVAAFGDGTTGSPPPESVPPAAPATPAPTATSAPQAPTTPAPTPTLDPGAAGPDPESVAMVAVGGVIGVGVLVLVLVALVGRRRPA